METIKRQTRVRMAVWSQVKVCGRRLSLRPIVCTIIRSVCDTKALLQLWYAACDAIQVFYAFAYLCLLLLIFLEHSGKVF